MFIKSVIFAVLAMFSLSAFAVKDIQKPEYVFDFDAPRVPQLVTKDVCKVYGENVRWSSTGISANLSNRQIKTNLYSRVAEDKTNTPQLVAITMLMHDDILDAVREYDQDKDYQEFARRYPNLDRHALHGYTAEARCLQFLGEVINTVKVVRKNKIAM